MPRRILLLVTDLEIGGTPTVVRELAIRLRGGGNTHIEVGSLKELGPNGAILAAQDIPVTAFNARSVISLPFVARRVRRLIAEKQIDTVLSFLVHANFVASLAVSGSVRLFQSIQTTQPRPAWHWRVQQWAARRAEGLVVPSASIAQVGVQRCGIERARFTVIPNAVDPSAFVRSPIPLSPPNDYPIGFIGRLDRIKRVPDLIRAVLPISDRVTLDIFGDGPERDRIERTAEFEGGGCVTLRGPVRRPQDVLGEIGLLVLPSEAEGFGLVLIEAMAAGVPVIGTNVPGIRDVIKDEHNGLLVDGNNPTKPLTAAIQRIIQDEPLRRRLIDGGLADVQSRFSWEVVLPQYRRLLDL